MKKAIFTCATGSWLDKAKICLQSVREHSDADLFLVTDQKGCNGVKTEDIVIPGVTVVTSVFDLAQPASAKALLPESAICLRMTGMEYLRELGYDMALYIDADVIMLQPLPDTFWNNRNGASIDMAAPAIWNKATLKKRIQAGYAKHELVVNMGGEYFNAGVLRANLKDPVWDNIFNRYLEYRVTNPYVGMLLDQDFLNFELHNNIEHLHLGYNFHCWDYRTGVKEGTWKVDNYPKEEYENVLLSLMDQVYFIHYASNQKPWQKPRVGNMSHFWGDVAKRTPGLTDDMNEQIERASNHRAVKTKHHDIKMPTYQLREEPNNTDSVNLMDLFG